MSCRRRPGRRCPTGGAAKKKEGQAAVRAQEQEALLQEAAEESEQRAVTAQQEEANFLYQEATEHGMLPLQHLLRREAGQGWRS